METQVKGYHSVDPSTEETIATFAATGDGELEAIVEAAHARHRGWGRTPIARRCELMRSAGAVLRGERDEYAETITVEMGKPITESRAEVEKCAVTCDYFADHAEELLADEPTPSDGARSFVAYQPLGTVLAIMPWNFPFWQVFRFAAPGLCAGNTAILKHATNVCGCALRIEDVFRQAGFPESVFRSVLISGGAASRLIADPRIAAVTFTGSDATGATVATAAAASVKKTVLELGGSDAFIVLADADVPRAAEIGARSRFQNCGQSCIAAKRFIVVDAIGDSFVEQLAGRAREIRIGSPREESTEMGPLARVDLRDSIEDQLRRTLGAGADLVVGGNRVGDRGYFMDATVVDRCAPGMAAVEEETFGPLAAVIRVSDEDQALEVANTSGYGLGGNLWTGDAEHGLDLARQLESGSAFINGMTHSDARLPFGGVKRSGYGRELGPAGIRELTNVRTMWVAKEGA